MKIRKGMEEQYSQWLERRRKEPYGKLMIEAVGSIGEALDNNRPADDAVRMVLSLSRSAFSSDKRAQVALTISLMHERGDEFRFNWNKHYMGEDWALDMELSKKRLYDPA